MLITCTDVFLIIISIYNLKGMEVMYTVLAIIPPDGAVFWQWYILNS